MNDNPYQAAVHAARLFQVGREALGSRKENAMYPTFKQQDTNRHLAVGFATRMNPRQLVHPVDWVKAAQQAGDHLSQKLWRGSLPLYDWAFLVIAAAHNAGGSSVWR